MERQPQRNSLGLSALSSCVRFAPNAVGTSKLDWDPTDSDTCLNTPHMAQAVRRKRCGAGGAAQQRAQKALLAQSTRQRARRDINLYCERALTISAPLVSLPGKGFGSRGGGIWHSADRPNATGAECPLATCTDSLSDKKPKT